MSLLPDFGAAVFKKMGDKPFRLRIYDLEDLIRAVEELAGKCIVDYGGTVAFTVAPGLYAISENEITFVPTGRYMLTVEYPTPGYSINFNGRKKLIDMFMNDGVRLFADQSRQYFEKGTNNIVIPCCPVEPINLNRGSYTELDSKRIQKAEAKRQRRLNTSAGGGF